MSNSEAPKVKGHQILQRVATRALDKDDYRQKLLNDPKAVLEAEGLTINASTEVVVLQDTPERVYLVLPAQSPADLDPGETRLGVLNIAVHF